MMRPPLNLKQKYKSGICIRNPTRRLVLLRNAD
jgi:hypothetical protein